MQNSLSSLLDNDYRRTKRPVYDPAGKTSEPTGARCYGDERRERLAAEGNIGARHPTVLTICAPRAVAAQIAAERARLAAWVASASPSWPERTRLDSIIGAMPAGILRVGSSIERARSLLVRPLAMMGWLKIGETGDWCRASDWNRFVEAMSSRARAVAIRVNNRRVS